MTERASRRDRAGFKILHVEDNPENRMLVRALLEAEGYTIVEAEDGLGGIEAALREEPALILLDINLPSVDGFEVGVILKSFPILQKTPIIAVTAYAMEGDRQRTLVAGCDGYIQKPIDADRFPQQVADFLRGKRERLEDREAEPYLRELNQRLVYRLVNHVEELKRFNQHFVHRAVQLEDLHEAVRDITSEMGVTTLLERLLPKLAEALGTNELTVELSDPPDVRVSARGTPAVAPRGVLDGAGLAGPEEWTEVEWRLPLAIRGRALGMMTGRKTVPPGARSDEEQLLKIVANHVAIAVENARAFAAEHEARGRLEVSETRYRELFENALDFVYVHDLDGTLKALNQAGARMSGYEPGELIGKSFAHLTSAEDFARAMDVVGRLVRGERARELFTCEVVRKDGTRGSLECALRVIHKNGAPVAVQGVARDITERRKLAQRQAAFGEIVKELAAQDDFDRLFGLIGRRVGELVEADSVVIFLLEGDEVVLRSTYGVADPGRLTQRASIARSRVGRVIVNKRPCVSADVAADAQSMGFRASLDVPILLRGEVIGVLGVLHRTPRSFTDEDVALLMSLAEHTAVALDRANLLKKLEARLRETETLLAITQALSSILDQTETMRRVAREIARTLGADMVGAYQGDAQQTSLRPIAGYHVPKELLEKFTQHPIPITGHPAIEEAWQHRRTVWSDDAGNDPRIDRGSYELFPHQTVLFVPMTVKGHPIGGFFVIWWHERRQFTADELRLVESISDQAAMFIENARLYSEATRRRREAEELARLARMLTESLDAADVGERIVESALLLLGGTMSVLRLLQPDGSLKLISSRGQARVLGALLPVMPPGAGVAGRAAREGMPAWSADVLADPAVVVPEELGRQVREQGVRAYLAVPLRVKRQIIGVIGIGYDVVRTFADTEVALLQTFADQAAIALENSRLYGDLRTALRAVEESQERIVQGERLRALGELAGGVAHDFNNVLAIIVGRAEVLLNETQDPELQRQLNVIVTVALDAAQTVKRIQEFTRQRRARPFQQVNLNDLVDEVVEVTRSRWKDEAQAKGIQYEVLAEKTPTPPTAGDPSEIREALTNIVFNALDAMPDGGQVRLRTGVEGDRVFCSVADTGHGMTEEVRQRIFDPFFTTKGERGTGLGLSVVYGIVTRHGGEVDVHTQYGQGSTFILRFPTGGTPATPDAAEPAPRSQRKGRILIIDDERQVGDVLSDLLTRDGHQVVVCTDAETGLTRIDGEPFDLVITDLGMPGVSGWEVARIVKVKRPGTPVTMVTGWGDRIDPAAARSRGVDHIVAKPFKRDHVREMVAAALSAPPAVPGAPDSAAARS